MTFPFPYLVYDATDMKVYGLNPTTGIITLYVLTTDYTINPTQLGQPSGVDVVFNIAPVDGTIISLYRIVPYIQPTVLPDNAPLPGSTIEKRIDRIVMMAQQLQQQVAAAYLPGSIPDRDYAPYDLSANGVPQIGITPGNTRDSTGGTIVIPRINNVPITHSPPPILVLGSDDLVVYCRYVVDEETGELDVNNADILSDTSVPADTSTLTYQLITNCKVNNPGGNTTVSGFGGGVRGSQNYTYCGPVPAVDGSGHQFNG